MNQTKLLNIIIPGIPVITIDYGIYKMWDFMYTHYYHCISNYDGTSKICGLWFDLSITQWALLFITAFGVIITYGYINYCYNLFDYATHGDHK